MKYKFFASLIAFLLLVGVAIAESKTETRENNKSKVFVFHENGEEKTFVFEGDHSRQKVDSVLRSHGIRHGMGKLHHGKEMEFHRGFPAMHKKKVMIKMDGDSVIEEFDIDFDFSFEDIMDHQFMAGALEDYLGEMDPEKIKKNHKMMIEKFHDTHIGHQKKMEMYHKKMGAHQRMMEKHHRMMEKMRKNRNMIIINPENSDEEVIVIKGGDKLSDAKEIEVKTKKKKGETVITIIQKDN